MSNKVNYKYCIVPCCTSSTVNTKEKLFFQVPKDAAKRKAWTDAMKRDDKLNPKLSSTSTLFCCEDHFSLPDDMENYWQWKLTNDVKRIQLKSGVIPHIFNCQKKPVLPSGERTAVKKRKTMHVVQDALVAFVNTTCSLDSTSDSIVPSTSSSQNESVNCSSPQNAEKGIQVNLRKPFRSKGTNTFVETASVGSSTINAGRSIATSTSPNKLTPDFAEIIECDDSSDFEPVKEESSEDFSSEEENLEKKKFKEHMVAGTIMSIEKEPKLYLGIPKNSFFLAKVLADQAKLPVSHIYIILKKIRLNMPFSILGIDFGLATSSVCRIFSKGLPVLASLLQELIVWPDTQSIQMRLPIPFRARYGNIISIIDCLEIEIEKPSNPVSQALTWSSYYNCNTVKYLISCTPDGLVSFISDGFGGRASDVIIVENCGYLDKLVPGYCVMADRGFKNISKMLQQKNCSLVRPPSVSTGNKSTREEVKQSKRIAALRIHVERVIGRLRDFDMLKPHACIDRKHVPVLDFVIVIACGIINMQDHLIKC